VADGKTVLCEKLLGTLTDFSGKTVDYVTVEWHEISKRVHRKTSQGGVDIAIRLGDEALVRPLTQDDVLATNDDRVFAVDIPPCEVLVIRVDPNHRDMAEKVCWEIGNKHVPLFRGETDGEFITPYDMPVETLLKKIHGVTVERGQRKLNFFRAISAAVGHTHNYAREQDYHCHEQ
jgi:urease accessory protein